MPHTHAHAHPSEYAHTRTRARTHTHTHAQGTPRGALGVLEVGEGPRINKIKNILGMLGMYRSRITPAVSFLNSSVGISRSLDGDDAYVTDIIDMVMPSGHR